MKQLLLVLTTTQDGGLPVQFRCEAGNASDSRAHEATWDALCRVAGGPDFLYVADSKLCGGDAMDHIDRRRGRFVTVMPRSRSEDARFRQWVFAHVARHAVERADGSREVFEPELTDLQSQILELLGVPTDRYDRS